MRLNWIAALLVASPAGRAASLGAPAPAEDEGGGFQVVVNSTCDQESISRGELSRLFLKKPGHWACGDPAAVVDQVEATPVRARFTRAVHRKSLKAVKAYWRKEIFSGQAVPPAERPGDAEVLDFVRGHRSGIGYVSAGAETPGVRVIQVLP